MLLKLIYSILLLSFWHIPSKAQTQEYKSFVLEFYEATPEMQPYLDVLLSSGVIQEAVEDLNQLFLMPYPVKIVFGSGIEGPQYYQGVISMPYEFLAQNYAVLVESEYSDVPEELAIAIVDATEFVLYHEIGHAVVDILDIPILGKEEDAVDGFAAMLASIWELDDITLAAADVFEGSVYLMEEGGMKNAEASFWGRHSLDKQRMYNLFCLVHGSNPEEFKDLLSEVGMPAEESGECQYKFNRNLLSWVRMFGQYQNPNNPDDVRFGPLPQGSNFGPTSGASGYGSSSNSSPGPSGWILVK